MKSIHRNSFWLLFARLTAQALAILFIAITARKLGLNDFGHFAFIASILLVGNTFTNFGTDTFLVRDIARAEHVTELASQALSLQLILSAVFCVAIIFYCDLPLFLYTLALFPLALYSVNNALLRALNRMDLFWLLSLANGIVQVVAAYFSSDVFTLCLFLLIGQILLSVLSISICSASLPDFSLLPLKDFRPIFRLTLPFAALTILLVLIQRLGVLSVSTFLGDSATGIFSSAARVVDGLKFGHYAILGALLPALSRGSPDSWQSFRKAFLLLMIVSLIFAITLVIFAAPIISILYGKDFLPAVDQLALLGWTLLPYTISSFISYSLIARGLENALVKATVISLITYVVLYLCLIHSSGLSGAVWSALIGECLQAVVFALFYVLNYQTVVSIRPACFSRDVSRPHTRIIMNEPVLTAKELLSYRRSTGGLIDFPPPRAVIFAPQKSLASYVLRKYWTKQVKGFLGELYLLKRTKAEVALSTAFGIGAPVIAGLADEFAALGVKQFALIGMAGGLQENLSAGSIVLSTGAIRGEGVSRHYLPPAEIVESSAEMSQGLSTILARQNHPYSSGITWTTDAPFRELRKDVLDYQNRRVLAVDMESAAMLAVAKSYSLPALAAFSIADNLSNGIWSMSKDLRPAQLSLSVLFEAVLEYFVNQTM